MGDPFLQFDVLVSEGRQPKGNSRSETPEFRRVARTWVPNKQQRLLKSSWSTQKSLRAWACASCRCW